MITLLSGRFDLKASEKASAAPMTPAARTNFRRSILLTKAIDESIALKYAPLPASTLRLSSKYGCQRPDGPRHLHNCVGYRRARAGPHSLLPARRPRANQH